MLNVLSAALSLAAYVPYIRAILRGETRPNRVSWWIWAMAGMLLFSSYHSLGSQAALGLAISALIGQIVVALLSLSYGVGGASRFDRLCLLGIAMVALLWWVTASPFLPHVLIVVIDFLALLPTFRKTLHEPATEDLSSWLLWTAAATVALLNVQAWTVANAFYPLYALMSGTVVASVLLRHHISCKNTPRR